MQAGVEYLRYHELTANCRQCVGNIDARGGAAPGQPRQRCSRIRSTSTPGTWRRSRSITRTYTLGVGDFPIDFTQPKYGAWLQDDWQVARNLTLNLGVRYDLSLNAFANDYFVPPFMAAGPHDDTNNIQPRVGFA